MDIKQEIIEDNKELTEEQRDKLAAKIASYWTKWDEDRNAQITTAKVIMEETYLNQPVKKPKEKYLQWKSDVKLNALYNIKRAKKSVIWRETWSNPVQMFDVRGTDEQTEQQAKMQKASIVDSLEKMEIGKQYDQALDDLFDIGEMIFKTDWERREKVVKRQKKSVGFILQNIMRSFTGAGFTTPEFQEQVLPYYENARVEAISPFMFVFDHAKYKPKNKDSWDSIIKIYKRFDTIENVKANKFYKLTQEQINQLEIEREQKTTESEKLVDMRDKDEFGGEYSILYAHGDFKINGKLYKNYIAEVFAGRFLIRFEENPLFINPFILAALEFDPKTKRGISPLKSCLSMCEKQQDLTNIAFDVQALTANPPCFCNEDLVTEDNSEPDGTIPLAPGKLIKFSTDYQGGLPQRVDISANGISDLLGLLDQKIADLSSVSSVMYGNIEDTKRTATELSLADKGSSAQASKELDIINQDLTIPMIKNVAELLATFKGGIDYVFAQEKGKNIEYKITESVRQAQYNYVYEDRNAINERKQKFQDLYQLATGCAQLPQLQDRINFEEIAKTGFENIGYDNVEKFFNEPTPAQQFGEQLEQIPPEMQAQVVSILSQQVQQMVQQYQVLQQQQEMQAQAQNQVQMDMYRQQARNEIEGQMVGM